MDILKEIESQINSIKKSDNNSYLISVLTHLGRADYYYARGVDDSNYFNDVIYRSNQAYEGALKESYKVLAEMSDSEVLKKSPNEIEKYFEVNNIFRERVLQLFKNYRQEWRNKSTHDHKLFFDASEAFLALTSVSSFVHLLLKQIQEKIAFNVQQKKLAEEKNNIEQLNQMFLDGTTEPVKKLLNLIIYFAKSNGLYIHSLSDIREVEILGLFDAYIRSIKGVKVQREPTALLNATIFRPDFIIEIDGSQIVLEFKREKYANSPDQNIINQLMLYIQATKSSSGIIYYPNFRSANPEISVHEVGNLDVGIKHEMFVIKT